MWKTKYLHKSRLVSSLIKVLPSNYFFYGILFLAALQALWYALSFQPTLFDEAKHIGKILVYSGHLSPFLGDQNPAWDHVGPISRDASYLFYYLMSWPLRLFSMFTQDSAMQVFGLRLISMSFFLAGLGLYRKALLRIGKVSRSAVNVAFLFLVITPGVAPLLGAVSYDSLSFLLFAILLNLSVRTVKSKKIEPQILLGILIIGIIMSLVKWTSIALLAPLLIYICYDLYAKHKTNTLHYLLESLKKMPRLWLTVLGLGVVLSVGLFIERPVFNNFVYGNPEPGCQKVISRERCMNFPDFAVYSQVGENRPDNFRPVGPAEYFINLWFPRMINTQVSLLPWDAVRLSPALPIMKELYFGMAIAGIVAVIAFSREYLKHIPNRLLFFVMSGYTLILILFLYEAYTIHAIPAAISGRYLIPIMPIFLYFVARSFIRLFGEHKNALLLLLFVTILLFTQGGGIITHLLTAQDRLYWQNKTTLGINEKIRQALKPLVKE